MSKYTDDPHYKMYKYILENLNRIINTDYATKTDINNVRNELTVLINNLGDTIPDGSSLGQDIVDLREQIKNLATKEDLEKLKKALADLTAEKKELEDALQEAEKNNVIGKTAKIKAGSEGFSDYPLVSFVANTWKTRAKVNTPSYKVLDICEVNQEKWIGDFKVDTGIWVGFYIEGAKEYLESINSGGVTANSTDSYFWFKQEDVEVTGVTTLELNENPDINDIFEFTLESEDK